MVIATTPHPMAIHWCQRHMMHAMTTTQYARTRLSANKPIKYTSLAVFSLAVLYLERWVHTLMENPVEKHPLIKGKKRPGKQYSHIAQTRSTICFMFHLQSVSWTPCKQGSHLHNFMKNHNGLITALTRFRRRLDWIRNALHPSLYPCHHVHAPQPLMQW